MSAHRTVFIINPRSASGKTAKRWPLIAQKASALFPTADFRFTEYAGHGEVLAQTALKEGSTQVVAVGGDGTIHEVLNGFFCTNGEKINDQASLGVMPMGTGSDLCRSLGIPRDPLQALSVLKNTPIDIDCGSISVGERKKYFANIGSVGVSGDIAKYFEQNGKGGTLSYVTGLFKSAKQYESRGFKINLLSADGSSNTLHFPDAFIAIFANGQYFGGGMHIAPDAKLNTGHLQCIFVRGVTGFEIMRYLPAIFRGKHLNSAPFHSEFAISAEVEVTKETWIELDGEPALRVAPNSSALITTLASKLKCHIGSTARLNR